MTNIRDRIEGYTDSQLGAVIEVLESLDTKDWRAEIEEFALCDAPYEVEKLLTLVREVREERG